MYPTFTQTTVTHTHCTVYVRPFWSAVITQLPLAQQYYFGRTASDDDVQARAAQQCLDTAGLLGADVTVQQRAVAELDENAGVSVSTAPYVPGASVSLSGPPGTGKTAVSLMYAFSGITKCSAVAGRSGGSHDHVVVVALIRQHAALVMTVHHSDNSPNITAITAGRNHVFQLLHQALETNVAMVMLDGVRDDMWGDYEAKFCALSAACFAKQVPLLTVQSLQAFTPNPDKHTNIPAVQALRAYSWELSELVLACQVDCGAVWFAVLQRQYRTFEQAASSDLERMIKLFLQRIRAAAQDATMTEKLQRMCLFDISLFELYCLAELDVLEQYPKCRRLQSSDRPYPSPPGNAECVVLAKKLLKELLTVKFGLCGGSARHMFEHSTSSLWEIYAVLVDGIDQVEDMWHDRSQPRSGRAINSLMKVLPSRGFDCRIAELQVECMDQLSSLELCGSENLLDWQLTEDAVEQLLKAINQERYPTALFQAGMTVRQIAAALQPDIELPAVVGDVQISIGIISRYVVSAVYNKLDRSAQASFLVKLKEEFLDNPSVCGFVYERMVLKFLARQDRNLQASTGSKCRALSDVDARRLPEGVTCDWLRGNSVCCESLNILSASIETTDTRIQQPPTDQAAHLQECIRQARQSDKDYLLLEPLKWNHKTYDAALIALGDSCDVITLQMTLSDRHSVCIGPLQQLCDAVGAHRCCHLAVVNSDQTAENFEFTTSLPCGLICQGNHIPVSVAVTCVPQAE